MYCPTGFQTILKDVDVRCRDVNDKEASDFYPCGPSAAAKTLAIRKGLS